MWASRTCTRVDISRPSRPHVNFRNYTLGGDDSAPLSGQDFERRTWSGSGRSGRKGRRRGGRSGTVVGVVELGGMRFAQGSFSRPIRDGSTRFSARVEEDPQQAQRTLDFAPTRPSASCTEIAQATRARPNSATSIIALEQSCLGRGDPNRSRRPQGSARTGARGPRVCA